MSILPFSIVYKENNKTFIQLCPNLTTYTNGCYIETTENEATGLAFKSIPYSLINQELEDSQETVSIEKVNNGDLMFKVSQNIVDTDAMLVDQEYRLTLLELGLAEEG